MNYKEVIENIYNEVKPFFGKGEVANYIPALANVNPRQYGIAIATMDGQIIGTGDYQTKFSIQSISKVFTWDGNRRELLSIRSSSLNMNTAFPVTRSSMPGLSWSRTN